MGKTIKIVLDLLAILTAASLLFLAGCSFFGWGPEDESLEIVVEEESDTIEEEIIPSSTITTITLWDYLEPKERMTLMESLDHFMVANENINIETRHFRNQEELEDQFEAASLAGAGPQLLLLDLDGVYRLAPSNVVKEIVDEVDYAFVLNGLKEVSSHNGRNYIVPFRAYDFLTLFYNKDLVNRAPKDFQGIFTYIQEMEEPENGEDQFGFLLNEGEADWIIPFIGGYDGWIIDYTSNSLTLDSKAMQKTLEFLDYSYNQSGLLQGGLEYGEIKELFKSGAAHMIIDYYGTYDEYKEIGLNVMLANIPRVWGGTKNPTPHISGLGFMININTYDEQLEAARQFISFMISEGIQTDWNNNTSTLPVLTRLEQVDSIKDDPILKAAFEQAKICRGKPYDKVLTVIRNAIDDNVGSMLAGDILPAEAALKIQEDAIRLRSGIVPFEDTEDGERVEDLSQDALTGETD